MVYPQVNNKLNEADILEVKVLLSIEKEGLIQALIQAMARKGDPKKVLFVTIEYECRSVLKFNTFL